MGFFSGLKQKVFGGKVQDPGFATVPVDPALAANQSRARALQLQAMNETDAAYADPEGQANSEAQAAMRAAGGQFGDVSRRTKQLMAQRGMQNSSIGTTAQLGAEKEVRSRVADIQASMPERIKQLRQQRASALAGSAAQGMQAGYVPDTYQQQKSQGMLPGLLKAGGAIVGGIYGGPAGAALGSQIGGAAGGMVSDYRNS